MAKKAKVKRDRSPGYNERQRLMQRARDDKRRLEKLEVAKLEAKQDRDPRGVDCSPASPLTEKDKEKKATGRPRKAQKLSLTGARGCAHQTSPLSLARSRARSLSCFWPEAVLKKVASNVFFGISTLECLRPRFARQWTPWPWRRRAPVAGPHLPRAEAD